MRRKLDGVELVPCHSLLKRTIRVGTGSAALFLTATVLAAAELIVLAPAVVSLACAVVAAGLWCRWLDRHEISDPGCAQDFLRHSLARLEDHFPYRSR